MTRRTGPTAITVVPAATGVPDSIVAEEAVQYEWRLDDARLQLTYDRSRSRAFYYGHHR